MTSTCWQISFFPASEPTAEFLNFMDSFFEVSAQNYSDDGKDEYVGYTDAYFDEQSMLQSAKLSNIVLPPYKITKLESENWLKDYVIEFPHFEVAEFCIYGIHEKTPPQSNKTLLQIYAATAFGSNHPTTLSCINAISELKKNGFTPAKILDIGTGSGILSLCAAKLWPSSEITASDIDDEAVIVTTSNTETNNLNSQIKAIQSNGYQNKLISQTAPYDLILSNILANPLINFAPDLSSCLKSKGYCILSGFIDNQTEDVISAHRQQGLRLIKLYSLENWRAALMQKE